jgi:K+-transporting ATPase ATPase C chain
MTVVLGVVYPLAITGISQVVFPGQANGSKKTVNGQLVGSSLVGQDGRIPLQTKSGRIVQGADGKPVMVPVMRYFQPRPSTATQYNAASTAFTNLGPNSKTARDTFKQNQREYLRLERPFRPGLRPIDIPVDAVTSSASGIDPHISPANARIQAHRVAKIRTLPLGKVHQLIDEHTTGRGLGLFGEPAVNVLELNLAMDKQ